eukprot:5452256-Pyramimonas_sp.AAC.4
MACNDDGSTTRSRCWAPSTQGSAFGAPAIRCLHPGRTPEVIHTPAPLGILTYGANNIDN